MAWHGCEGIFLCKCLYSVPLGWGTGSNSCLYLCIGWQFKVLELLGVLSRCAESALVQGFIFVLVQGVAHYRHQFVSEGGPGHGFTSLK